MVEALIAAGAAIIVGLLSFAGVAMTNNKANNKMQNDMRVAQAVTDTKLDKLTDEVHLHNNFAQRIPTLEQQQKSTESRLKALEKAVQPVATLEANQEEIMRRLATLEGLHHKQA